MSSHVEEDEDMNPNVAVGQEITEKYYNVEVFEALVEHDE